MANLIYVNLEVCHANTDGSAWYAYFDGKPSYEDIQQAQTDESLRAKAPLGLEADVLGEGEEAPTPLSEHAGMHRFYVGGAC